jgi:hypothetical protein
MQKTGFTSAKIAATEMEPGTDAEPQFRERLVKRKETRKLLRIHPRKFFKLITF